MMVNEQLASRWMERMPLRWALGGLLLGIIWGAISAYFQGSLKNPVGGLEAGLVRLVVIIVLPLALLGLIWGYSERAKLVRSANQSNAILSKAMRRTVWRQIGKAMICGMAFGIFVNLSPYARGALPWDTPEHIVNNLSAALGFVLLAVPIGLVVGYILKRNLFRRLSYED